MIKCGKSDVKRRAIRPLSNEVTLDAAPAWIDSLSAVVTTEAKLHLFPGTSTRGGVRVLVEEESENEYNMAS